jgi:hypothetical protein
MPKKKPATYKQKQPKKRKESTYNKILKQVTKINNKLPEDRKLSIKERRKLIKLKILPNYKDVPAYKVKVKDLKVLIFTEYENLPPRELCDINYLDISPYINVEWFSLDETISELVPDCVYVKVSAGDFGETKIFNTRDYEYSQAGVRSIVEEIRPEAELYPSGKYIFSAYKKLRPRKKNDGNPENYYLDFILFIEDKKGNKDPQAEPVSVDFVVPKTRETRSKKTKIKHIIEEKIKKLAQTKASRRRAKVTLKKNLEDFDKKVKSIKKTKKPSPKKIDARDKQFAKTSALLEKYFSEGKLTQKQYDEAIAKLLKEYEK